MFFCTCVRPLVPSWVVPTQEFTTRQCCPHTYLGAANGSQLCVAIFVEVLSHLRGLAAACLPHHNHNWVLTDDLRQQMRRGGQHSQLQKPGCCTTATVVMITQAMHCLPLPLHHLTCCPARALLCTPLSSSNKQLKRKSPTCTMYTGSDCRCYEVVFAPPN